MKRKTKQHTYQSLDYSTDIELDTGTAYGQAIQSLDVAAQKAQADGDTQALLEITKIWLHIADELEEESEDGRRGIGFA